MPRCPLILWNRDRLILIGKLPGDPSNTGGMKTSLNKALCPEDIKLNHFKFFLDAVKSIRVRLKVVCDIPRARR